MKNLLAFFLLTLSSITWSKESPSEFMTCHPKMEVYLHFEESGLPELHSTVYKGEIKRFPVLLRFSRIRSGLKVWNPYPNNNYLAIENVPHPGDQCPGLIDDKEAYLNFNQKCHMNFLVNPKNHSIGAVLRLKMHFMLYVHKKCGINFDVPLYINVLVIPHPLSMYGIPQQEATIGNEFILPLRNWVAYYDENRENNGNVGLDMSQKDMEELNKLGLRFEPSDFTIRGVPNKVGIVTFSIGTHNTFSQAAPTNLTLNIRYNERDKPRFKKNYSIAAARPEEMYTINLMDLLEANPGFNVNNQISFQLDKSYPNPGWLNIKSEDPRFLVGTPDKNLAGQTVAVTIMATSNTGGNAATPLTIHIPIAQDPTLRPTIKHFEMEQAAGNQFSTTLAKYIEDPANHPNLKVLIDKIEPEGTELKIAITNHTTLKGIIPNNATGQLYQITLHANTPAGGDSEKVTIPLQITPDPNRKPYFKEDNPHLPLVYPGQSYSHDFVANNDIFPEYEDAPYEISFAEKYEHPKWLTLENNKLSAKTVPDDVASDIPIHLIIKNIPGGISTLITLHLTAMN
jgi:hypothetical protein